MSLKVEIGSEEKILYVGSYDRKDGKSQYIPGFPGGNIYVPLQIAGVCGFSLISAGIVVTGNGLIGSPTYIDETFSLVTYSNEPNSVKIGTVIWSGTYKENIVDGITAPSIQEFDVIGSSGIYSDVTKVIIDYNNLVRIVYFIGKK